MEQNLWIVMFTEYFNNVVTLLRERGITQIPDQSTVKDDYVSGKTALESVEEFVMDWATED